jgi:hypothetical protein
MEDKFKLENLSKRNVYQVPDGYFDKLPSVIMQRVQPGGTSNSRSWFGLRYYSLRVALATLVTGGILATGLYLNQAPAAEPAPMASLAEIPNEEIMQYLLASGKVDPMDMADLSISDPYFWQEFGEDDYLDN